MAKIGIDFGTTNSSLVSYDRETDDFMYFGSSDSTDRPTPSVVWYHDNHIDVGKTAKEHQIKFCNIPGHQIVTSIKSKLGSNQEISLFGNLCKPYSIAAEIIKHLKQVAINEYALKAHVSLDSAVFTIPINFSGKQRSDLREAAEIAGINIETFIHEPFAALIGYLFSNNNNQGVLAANDSYILVFDWGGGTLDITIIKVENQKMYEVGTSELSGIAGDKFDAELAALVRNKFSEKYSSVYNLEYIKRMLDEKSDQILINAEKCKIDLSSNLQSEILVEEIIYDEASRKFFDIDETISRSDFEKCIKHHVDAATNRIDEALRAAGISHEQVAFVLMTGGTSNIPIVKRVVENKFGSRVKTSSKPDMVIAQGAAVVSEMGWSPCLSKNIMVEMSDNSYWVAFEKDMPLVRQRMPKLEEVFTCVDTRDLEAKLIIVEGDDQNKKDRNLAIMKVPVANPPSLRSPDEIIVDFSINENIILAVKGYSSRSGIRKTIEIHDICFGLEMR